MILRRVCNPSKLKFYSGDGVVHSLRRDIVGTLGFHEGSFLFIYLG